MTPLLLKLALPIVQFGGAILISRRVSWRKHPALITYLTSEATWQVLALLGVSVHLWAIPIQIAIRAAVVLEVAKFARIDLSGRASPFMGLLLAAAAFAAGCAHGFSVTQRVYLFRQYAVLGLCGALGCIVLHRALVTVLECRRHRLYRIGVTAWIAVIAVAGTFVRGGLGYRFLPYTQKTWSIVDLATYCALIVTVGALALAIAGTVPARKVQARVADVWLRRAA